MYIYNPFCENVKKKINLWLSTDNSQQTTDFGYAVPELVEGITLGTSTGSVTGELSTKKRRVNNPILFLGFVDTSLPWRLVVFK